ncbi:MULTISPECIES: dTDP-4-dehydrorhamnose 3,5-epimerase family protein [Lactococcus]|uniref:dTDP-4-dehydrorhamnose 35-epimerase related enzyme n=1 Tax=Lactococcus lactis subsp. lactis TaxID=1360 RepID=A0A1V0NF12_LACLL|nr:dTDP-4-dehydrorhamnose 3,5-epimerase [Lactococcus lactis]ARD98499.1 dTDP-4-dehydrorhamnose 35-epimerase related enzyme [Lactococcus lactis subsp. lactis]MDS1012890.1 dTDP-4-dehydrorhamnose 3,5-epimerase [Lactococcus lactis]NLS47340.1 dTDP-4-keto-6-deoxy-D-glucose epimerase [Lactococcus lactis]TKD78612.1 dTDP-4-keto-6-deoxy-D-glucose epimerase [Lactococcus lactis]UXV69036.1 dTDP-4-dehydrorhamnose 3,5-epimerase [Lactococcus lactis subsp. lactis]
MKTKLHIEALSASDSKIEGLKIINAKMVTDDRGTVRELYRQSSYSDFLPTGVSAWRQVNLTRTKRGAVRGLHGEAMSKLITVAHGAAFGVYVDTRPGSKTIGAVETVNITPGVQVFVPQGVCNGFQALDDDTEYLYFFDNEWMPGMSGVALTPLDADLHIDWPIHINPNDLEQISEKDSKAPKFQELLNNQAKKPNA